MMKPAVAPRETRSTEAVAEIHPVHGMAALVRLIYEGRDVSPVWEKLFSRASADPQDAAAFLDMSIILRTLGQSEKAALAQKAALASSRSFTVRYGDGTGPRVLALVAPGDFMANTPIDFLLEDSNATLLLHYVDAETKTLEDVQDHDVAFVAVGESEANSPILENLERLLRGWCGPVLNNAPSRIAALTRDGVARMMADEASILTPVAVRTTREALTKLAANDLALDVLLRDGTYPIIVRPAGTHAGKGMEKISGQAELAPYLARTPVTDFYVCPFIDYSGPDGKFRKQRIALIDGKPFASHLAVSEHWMVHYLSAGMAKHEDRRAEEAAWMQNFDTDFAVRHAQAFEALHRRIGLDYFAIDCAELPDGRLLLFEADVAMIVHAMDSKETFPYKKDAMLKLFGAFRAALLGRISGARDSFA
jgi:hypothetical protein